MDSNRNVSIFFKFSLLLSCSVHVILCFLLKIHIYVDYVFSLSFRTLCNVQSNLGTLMLHSISVLFSLLIRIFLCINTCLRFSLFLYFSGFRYYIFHSVFKSVNKYLNSCTCLISVSSLRRPKLGLFHLLRTIKRIKIAIYLI